MATRPLPNLPEEFETLSKEEQVEYVQRLWDRISSSEEDVPIPEWHRDLLDERLDSRSPDDDSDWETVRARLRDARDD